MTADAYGYDDSPHFEKLRHHKKVNGGRKRHNPIAGMAHNTRLRVRRIDHLTSGAGMPPRIKQREQAK